MSQPGEGVALDVDALLDDPGTRVVVCCGSGGVGKTTTAAALALRAAERGRRAVVLTIDPARRLAQSLGLDELDNSPRPVAGIGDGGSLDAMMLDMKRTFDEVVEAHASPEKARQILENPFYQVLSSSFAGTQEYMAMEKLGQLRSMRTREPGDSAGGSPGTEGADASEGAEADKASGASAADDASGAAARDVWDLIVVDTPPSRSALDFLDAPRRLGSFLDGRFIRLLLAPAKAGGRAYLRVLSSVAGGVVGVMNRVLGAQVLADVQTFVLAFDSMFGGFRQRAEETYALLASEGTAFVVVASPEPDAVREACFFVDRLQTEGMPLAGVVVNRLTTTLVPGLAPDEALDAADHTTSPTRELLRIHARRAMRRQAELSVVERLARLQPVVPTVTAPDRPVDVTDLGGLRAVGADLAEAVAVPLSAPPP